MIPFEAERNFTEQTKNTCILSLFLKLLFGGYTAQTKCAASWQLALNSFVRIIKMRQGEIQDMSGTDYNGTQYQITSWCKRMLRDHVKDGAFCIDATMGNGNDTQYLCELAGVNGHVLAFDIQDIAVERTRERLEKHLPFCNYELILDSHSHLRNYAEPESVDCIVFNLGYLPSGDHSVATRPDTTLSAIGQGLELLKPGGMMSICIYSGGDSGFEEKESVLSYLKGLDVKKYLVLVTEYYNRPNHPPIPAFVIRLGGKNGPGMQG